MRALPKREIFRGEKGTPQQTNTKKKRTDFRICVHINYSLKRPRAKLFDDVSRTRLHGFTNTHPHPATQTWNARVRDSRARALARWGLLEVRLFFGDFVSLGKNMCLTRLWTPRDGSRRFNDVLFFFLSLSPSLVLRAIAKQTRSSSSSSRSWIHPFDLDRFFGSTGVTRWMTR